MNKTTRNSLILGVIGIVAGFFAIKMQLPNLPQEALDEINAELGRIEMLYVIGAVQIGVIAVILSYIGQLMLPKTGFKFITSFNRKSVVISVVLGFAASISIVFLDYVVFKELMKDINTDFVFSISYFIASVLYGGIIEEVIMRLFMLTGIVFILTFITKTKRNWYVYFALIITSILFGIGHLPAMSFLTELTGMIIFRTILLNLIPALIYGMLYIKKDLSHAMIAHISTHLLIQLVIGPFFL